eukprot:scaffold50838_cov70-Cyclotella_meneghiniana.AAC.4
MDCSYFITSFIREALYEKSRGARLGGLPHPHHIRRVFRFRKVLVDSNDAPELLGHSITSQSQLPYHRTTTQHVFVVMVVHYSFTELIFDIKQTVAPKSKLDERTLTQIAVKNASSQDVQSSEATRPSSKQINNNYFFSQPRKRPIELIGVALYGEYITMSYFLSLRVPTLYLTENTSTVEEICRTLFQENATSSFQPETQKLDPLRALSLVGGMKVPSWYIPDQIPISTLYHGPKSRVVTPVTPKSGCGDGCGQYNEFKSQPCPTIYYTNGEILEGSS